MVLKRKQMITVYGGSNCSACEGVKSAFNAANIQYEYVDILAADASAEHKDIFFGMNFRSIPQIFEDGNYVGNASVANDVLERYRSGGSNE